MVVLSMHGTKEQVFRALKAGARGYLLKRSAGPKLIDAVKAVCRGERFLSRQITDVVVDDYVVTGTSDL
jgi:DNA-binding NarL/FixJ family response regulator